MGVSSLPGPQHSKLKMDGVGSLDDFNVSLSSIILGFRNKWRERKTQKPRRGEECWWEEANAKEGRIMKGGGNKRRRKEGISQSRWHLLISLEKGEGRTFTSRITRKLYSQAAKSCLPPVSHGWCCWEPWLMLVRGMAGVSEGHGWCWWGAWLDTGEGHGWCCWGP